MLSTITSSIIVIYLVQLVIIQLLMDVAYGGCCQLCHLQMLCLFVLTGVVSLAVWHWLSSSAFSQFNCSPENSFGWVGGGGGYTYVQKKQLSEKAHTHTHTHTHTHYNCKEIQASLPCVHVYSIHVPIMCIYQAILADYAWLSLEKYIILKARVFVFSNNICSRVQLKEN